jgi:hypothetical protein
VVGFDVVFCVVSFNVGACGDGLVVGARVLVVGFEVG